MSIIYLKNCYGMVSIIFQHTLMAVTSMGTVIDMADRRISSLVAVILVS